MSKNVEELKPGSDFVEEGDDVEISMDAELFSSLFSLASCFILAEVQVRIENDGLYVRQMDEAHVGLTDIFIPKSYFKTLEKGQKISELRLPVKELKGVLTRLNSSDVIRFTVTDKGKLHVEIKGKRLRVFNLPLLKPEELSRRKPVLTLTNKVKTSLEGVKSAIEDADKLISRTKKKTEGYMAAIVTFRYAPMGLQILSASDSGLYSTEAMLTSGWDIMKSIGKVGDSVMVSILYLTVFVATVSKVTNIIQIEFSTDMPLHIIPELPFKDIEVSYWVAPRIDPEKMAAGT